MYNIFAMAEEQLNMEVQIIEEPQKKKPGRPRTRQIIKPEDKNPVGRPVEPNAPTKSKEYFKNYYHEKRKALVECSQCNCMVTKASLSAHKRSNKCKLIFNLLNKQ